MWEYTPSHIALLPSKGHNSLVMVLTDLYRFSSQMCAHLAIEIVEGKYQRERACLTLSNKRCHSDNSDQQWLSPHLCSHHVNHKFLSNVWLHMRYGYINSSYQTFFQSRKTLVPSFPIKFVPFCFLISRNMSLMAPMVIVQCYYFILSF